MNKFIIITMFDHEIHEYPEHLPIPLPTQISVTDAYGYMVNTGQWYRLWKGLETSRMYTGGRTNFIMSRQWAERPPDKVPGRIKAQVTLLS